MLRLFSTHFGVRAPALALAVLGTCTVCGTASGAFDAPASAGPLAVQSATLDPPTSLGARNLCRTNRYTYVRLNWTDPTSPAVASLAVQRSSDGGVTYTQIGTVTLGRLRYFDTTIVGGTTYTYEVVSVRNLWTATSSPVTITTLHLATCR